MKWRIVALVAALSLVAGACGGDVASSCDGIADDAVALVQTLIDEIDGMTLDELSEIGADFANELAADFDDLQARADEANCSDAEMGDLVEERVGDLTADTQFGQLFIEQFRAEGFGG